MAIKALNVHKAILFINVMLLLSTVTIITLKKTSQPSTPLLQTQKIPNSNKTIELTYVNETLVKATIMLNNQLIISWNEDVVKQAIWLNNCLKGEVGVTETCVASGFTLDFSDPKHIHAVVGDVYFDEEEVLYIIEVLTQEHT